MRISAARRVWLYLALTLLMIVFIGPILWFLLLAIKPPDAAFARPPVLFFKPSWSGFYETFIDPGTNAGQLLNSVIVAGGAVLLNLPFSVPAAYAISRFAFRGRRNLMLWYLGLMMAPPVAFLIPYFILANAVGLTGTYLAMILVLQTVVVPFSIWLQKSFFDDIPVDLEAAAALDGARLPAILWHVTLPLATPGLIVTAMFAFVFAWNNAAFPLVLSNQATATLPIGTLGYFGNTGVTWNDIGAAAIAAMLPPMLIFLLMGRYVVRGLTF
ncbi:MAG TPA: carbohydrate ABC transporter permease, partial [Acidisoma sp.]|uniref:carbohydrate ABC transporter permease n=1 Tax=Acidisoma sp. TaxID=1872115 RepID=UPI002B713834